MNEIKQVIVVRNDIKMGKGKIAAQVAHASVSAFVETLKVNKKLAEDWLFTGQKKVVLKVDSLEELLSLYKKAIEKGLIAVIIEDKGLTQLPEGTITCLGIGPDENNKIDEITSKLKLL
ncbi:MAG: peptidyl-tRNA hydrolase Pth2 [Thermoproteota archaeon]|jgi:PTH2 family peptidyl-tRNA hydrolase|nr:peptidyl-tRNA hydrolase Pth2 [Thermoproteota archaeon]